MKKILTVSLFAMMAVSAANADIASTAYVETAKTTAISTAASDATSKANAAKEAAISAAASDATSKANQAKADAIAAIPAVDSTFNKDSNNAATSKAIAGYISSELGVLNGQQSTINDSIGEMKADIAAINNETTGILALAKADAKSKADAAQSAAESKVTALQNGAVKTNTDNIAAMDEAYKAADAALDGRVDTLESDNTTNKSNITNLQTAVNNLNTGENSVSSQIANALVDYSTTEQMNTAITDNAVNTVEAGTTNGTILVDKSPVSITGLKSAAYTESSAYDASGSAATAKSEAIAAAKTETTNQVNLLKNGAVKTNTDNIAAMDKAYKDADTALGNRLTTAEGDITALETSLSADGTTGKAIADNTAKISAMDAAYKAADTTTLNSAKSYADGLASNYDAAGSAAAAQTAAVNAAKTAADATYQVKSSALSVGAAGGAWTDLTQAEGYSKTGTHSLVLKNGTIQWEAVSY